MKRHVYANVLVTVLAFLPAGLASCKHKPSGDSSGGAQPSTTADSGGSADNDDTDDDDSGPSTDDSGGGKHGKHGKKHANNEDGGGGGGKDEPTAKFVINKPTPEPMEAPALKKLPKIPTLPNFPERGKYPKEAPIPKGGDAEGCGQVWTGNEFQPVECVDPDHHSKHHRAAKVVVPYEKMKQPTDKLPKMVDHRFDGMEGPVRKQEGPQCTAFSFTSALDHSYSRWTGKPGDFSVMQVWARYRQLEEKAAADANVGDYVADESDWPYDAKLANSWLKCGKGVKEPCGKKIDEAKLKELDGKKKAIEITKIELVSATQFDVVKEKIAGGQDVLVGLKLPNFTVAGEAGSKYIVGTQKGAAKEGHETLLCGYADTPHGTYFLIHNSWGTKWGDDGYAWMHEDLIKKFWLDSRITIPDVQPVEVAELRRKAHGSFMAKCEKDHAPDSISGLCAKKCPDGSPRHNDVCADEKMSKECRPGHINLAGECVLSAPKSSGSEGKVKWECGPGGCVYEVSQGELECREKECQVSCPAPDFRLATMKKGLVCVL
jgi:hypothetical protein